MSPRLIAELVGILALLGGFWWYSAHERSVGAEKCLNADQTAVTAQIEHNTKVEANETKQSNEQVTDLKVELASPPSASAPHLRMCNPRSASPVSGNVGPRPDPAPEKEQPTMVQRPDIGPLIDKRFEDDDKLIQTLQARIESEKGICR